MPREDGFFEAELVDSQAVTPSVRQLDFAVPAEAASFLPGAHIDILLPLDQDDRRRSYSLLPVEAPAGSPRLRIAVKRLAASRGGSAYMHGLRPGARLRVSPPQNRFALNFDAPAYLFVAGGIGITPLVSMVQALAQWGRPCRFLYAAKTEAELAFADRLRAHLGDKLETFVSDRGERIDLEAAIARLDPEGEMYFCGPLRFLDAAREAWQAAGRPPGKLRYESFASSGRYPARSFRVTVAESAEPVEVPPESTILDSLLAADVDMIADCRRGECGLCTARILSCDGPVDHRDVFLSQAEKAENTKLVTCVSRIAGGEVTLDTGYRPEGG